MGIGGKQGGSEHVYKELTPVLNACQAIGLFTVVALVYSYLMNNSFTTFVSVLF